MEARAEISMALTGRNTLETLIEEENWELALKNPKTGRSQIFTLPYAED